MSMINNSHSTKFYMNDCRMKFFHFPKVGVVNGHQISKRNGLRHVEFRILSRGDGVCPNPKGR